MAPIHRSHYLTAAFVGPIQERTKWLLRGALWIVIVGSRHKEHCYCIKRTICSRNNAIKLSVNTQCKVESCLSGAGWGQLLREPHFCVCVVVGSFF